MHTTTIYYMKNSNPEGPEFIQAVGLPVDEDLAEHRSNPPKSPIDYPYSYDPYSVYYVPGITHNHTAYSDRFQNWGVEQMTQACQVAFNDSDMHIQKRTPDQVEVFLQTYYQDPELKLTRIVEWCNASNGYPYWLFYFQSDKIK